MDKKAKLPSIKDVASLVKDLKREIGDEYRASEDEDIPGMSITIGIDPNDGSWAYQTGDNSYSGGAYGYQFWGVGAIYRRSNSRDVAKALIEDAADQIYSCGDYE